MKKITSKFHLGALTIVIQLWGDFFRRSITTWKSWPNVLKFQSIFILATDLPTLTILPWVSRFFNVSHGLSTGLPISRFLGKHFGDEVAYIRNRTTPCCKFRPSYPLIPVLKVIKEKKKRHLVTRNKELIHPRPNGKKFRLIWNGKKWISLLFVESPDFVLGSLGFPLSEVGKSVAIRCNRRHRK